MLSGDVWASWLKEKSVLQIFFRHWRWFSSTPKENTDLRIMKGSLQGWGFLLQIFWRGLESSWMCFERR